MGLLLGYTNDVSFSPDATRVLTAHGSVYCAPNGGCYQDRSGQFIWNFPGASLIAGQGDSLDGIIESIDYSPDGSIFATGRSYNNVGEIRIYNSSGFTLVRTLPGHYLETNKVRFSPNGQLLASVGYDGNLKIWNVSDGLLLRTLFHGSYSNGGSPISVAFSPSGEFLATSGYGTNTVVKVWRVSDGTLVHTLPGGVPGPDQSAFNNTVMFSPNGTYVAATVSYNFGSGSRGLIRFWNVNTGLIAHEFIDENIGGGSSSSRTVIRSFAFSPTGNLFAYSVGNMIKVTKTDLSLNTLSSILNIRLIPEGFYNSASKSLNRKDTATAYLRSTVFPYVIVDSAKAEIDSVTFTGSFNVSNASSGTYYIVVKHRNSFETWSRTGGEIFSQGLPMNYDFTSSQSQAFGNNLKLADTSPLRYAIYSGDVNQDGSMNLADNILISNNSANFITGFINTDLNGDSFTNLNDILIAYNNSNGFVATIRP